jgi:hypothetical protein
VSRLTFGEGKLSVDNTEGLRAAKLAAKNRGDFGSALLSAGYYAKKMQKTMHLYPGNSYGHGVWRVSDKPSEYLNPINNSGHRLVAVTPDLAVTYLEPADVALPPGTERG